MENGETTNVNAERPDSEPQSHGFWKGVLEWVQVVAIALVISIPIRLFIAEPFVVHGASMDPTFSTGQFLIVDRISYRVGEPKRGDVVIFKFPNNPRVYYIKRIIGLPGETVEIKNGKVFVTSSSTAPGGIAIDENYVQPSHASHETLTAELEEDEYFVMGDNRAESSDSRFWGALDEDLIVGRPIVRLLPLTELSIFPGHYEQKSNE